MTDHDILEVMGELYEAALHPKRLPQVHARVRAMLAETGVELPSMEQGDIMEKLTREDVAGVKGLVRQGEAESFQFMSGGETLVMQPAANGDLSAAAQWQAHSVWPQAAPNYQYYPPRVKQRAFRQWEAATKPAPRLASHLNRAMRLARRVQALEFERMLGHSVADRLFFGVCILDTEGSVLHHNLAAAEIIAAGDGLTLDHDGLCVASSKARQRYAEAFTVAAGGSADDAPELSSVITVSRPSGKRHYTLWLSSIKARHSYQAQRAAVLVFMTDPERSVRPKPNTLATALGLTVRETELALALAGGDSLEEAAGRLGITGATARSYLKLIFRKTRANRQGELIRLVLSTAMALPGDSISA